MTTHEMLAREKKARALAAVLLHERLTPTEAKRLSHASWIGLAGLARCKPPSQATKELVIRMLEEGSEP